MKKLNNGRKYGVTPLGIFNEGQGKGLTYFIPCECGKLNSNHVISAINLHISTNPSKTTLILSFDNCAVNKNKYVIAFCYELVNSGVFAEVQIHFMVAGHTKFAPDRMFAYNTNMIKDKPMYEVIDLVKAVNSGRSKSYRAEEIQVGDGRLLDYKGAYEYMFPALTGIQKYHCFRFTKATATLARLEVKEWTESDWVEKHSFKAKKGHQQTQKLPLSRKELSAKKLADLKKQAVFVPDGLSYVTI